VHFSANFQRPLAKKLRRYVLEVQKMVRTYSITMPWCLVGLGRCVPPGGEEKFDFVFFCPSSFERQRFYRLRNQGVGMYAILVSMDTGRFIVVHRIQTLSLRR